MDSPVPQLNVRTLKISDHAVIRAKERMKCEGKSKSEILNACKSILGNQFTKYVGISPCEKGDKSHMFVNKKFAFYISLDYTMLLTIINYESKVGNIRHFSRLENQIRTLYEKELRRLEKLESSNVKKLEYLKLKEDVDISQVKLKIYQTRSKSAKSNYELQLISLSGESRLLESELWKIRTDKKAIMNTMASTVYV